MRWLAFNASPRGKKSNTHVMLEQMRAGMLEASLEASWEELFLNRVQEHEAAVDRLSEADGIVFAYPLYTDSMPGIAVRFLETLYHRLQLNKRLARPDLPAAFLVHSGFPEGVHTAHLPDLHRRICRRFGFRYLGTIRKPGSEGVRLMPPTMQRSLFARLRESGSMLACGESLDQGQIDNLVRYERLGPPRQLLLRAGEKIGIANMYWNRMLKQHHAWDARFDAPYSQPWGRS